jgi:hypothetical protein
MSNNQPILLQDLGMQYPTDKSKKKYRFGLYQCCCGKEFRTIIYNVESKHTTSCGCYHSDVITKHGLAKHPMYGVWRSMIGRTTKETTDSYKFYAPRGIIVCKRWLSVENFIEDMSPSYVEGLTIDRINNDLGYFKENCRWATKSTQARNTRRLKSTNTSGYRGVNFSRSINRWVARVGINGDRKYLGYFNTALEAAIARDTYIIENCLGHTLNCVI